jgi:hypothetical protein
MVQSRLMHYYQHGGTKPQLQSTSVSIHGTLVETIVIRFTDRATYAEMPGCHEQYAQVWYDKSIGYYSTERS